MALMDELKKLSPQELAEVAGMIDPGLKATRAGVAIRDRVFKANAAVGSALNSYLKKVKDGDHDIKPPSLEELLALWEATYKAN